MKTTKEKIAIMQAFEDGKKIELYSKTDNVWYNATSPDWNWATCDYRINPEHEYVPFTFEDAEFLIGKIVKHKTASEVFMLVRIGFDNVVGISYKGFLENYVFLDGSPCGKLKQ